MNVTDTDNEPAMTDSIQNDAFSCLGRGRDEVLSNLGLLGCAEVCAVANIINGLADPGCIDNKLHLVENGIAALTEHVLLRRITVSKLRAKMEVKNLKAKLTELQAVQRLPF